MKFVFRLSAACLLSCLAHSAIAKESVIPTLVPGLKLTCSFEWGCFSVAGRPDATRCGPNPRNISVHVSPDGNVASLEHYGKNSQGVALAYGTEDKGEVIAIMVGAPANTSLLSVFPDGSATWTHHQKIIGTSANSDFGTCTPEGT
ncbi:MAG: hypothetical protein BM558_03705 [Roseobacter sp. MedPE-SW]|nr:MAG: hypothetical protein BM558_03705 [Roseobacter sp. MedPE-SW]